MTINLSFNTVLFLIFLTLKLVGTITWSWWLVTAPLWLPFVILLAIAGITYSIALVIQLFGK